MTSKGVSVVIVTLNRAESLSRTLSALRLQNYPSFEVVVVNGPSTDHTAAVLESFSGVVAVDCAEANISRARNLGIAASAGEFIAFIDDDALPEFHWLHEMVAAFESADIAGVGGLVLDHSGMEFQYKYSAVNRLGATTHRNDVPFEAQCFPGSFSVPYLQGTNAVFRRSALVAIQGFDETYEYFHDETDLCVRLVDRGLAIRQLSQGVVHHKSAPSDTRNTERIVTNLFPIVKNSVYFAHRHAVGYRSEADIASSLDSYARHWVDDLQRNAAAGRIDASLGKSASTTAESAIVAGVAAAARGPQFGVFSSNTGPIRSFNALTPVRERRLILVAPSVAVWTDSAVPTDGTELRLVVPSQSVSTVELESGVWIHRIHCSDFEEATANELRRLAEWDSNYEVATHRDLGFDFLAPYTSLFIGADSTPPAARAVGDQWLHRGRIGFSL